MFTKKTVGPGHSTSCTFRGFFRQQGLGGGLPLRHVPSHIVLGAGASRISRACAQRVTRWVRRNACERSGIRWREARGAHEDVPSGTGPLVHRWRVASSARTHTESVLWLMLFHEWKPFVLRCPVLFAPRWRSALRWMVHRIRLVIPRFRYTELRRGRDRRRASCVTTTLAFSSCNSISSYAVSRSFLGQFPT